MIFTRVQTKRTWNWASQSLTWAVDHLDWWGRGGQPTNQMHSHCTWNNGLLMRVWPRKKRLLDKTVALWASYRRTWHFCCLQNNVFVFSALLKDLVPNLGSGFSVALEEEEQVCVSRSLSRRNGCWTRRWRQPIWEEEDGHWSLEKSGRVSRLAVQACVYLCVRLWSEVRAWRLNPSPTSGCCI